MVKEAEANKEADERRREEVETKNKAESYVNEMENRVNEHGNLVSGEVLSRTKDAIENLKKDIQSLSPTDLKNKLPEYERTFAEFEQAAQQAGANANPNSSSDQGGHSSNDDGPINA